MIPFSKVLFGPEEETAAIRVIRSGYLTQGQEVFYFEKEFAEFLNAPYVVAVDNCTNALFLSLQYLYEKEGPVSIGCPGITFASVAHSIKHAGHGLRFLDEYHVGSAYQLEGTNIWDCAHEISRGMYVPNTTQCFSFYPNKILSSAEGGAIATDDKIFAEWLRLARNNGRLSNTTYDYSIVFRGWKMNMTDLQAAIAREQLKKLDGFNSRRKWIKDCYDLHFKQINKGAYLYVILVDNREELMKKVLNRLELSYHFKPLYYQPAYRNYPTLPYLESIKDKIVTLPIYPSMTDEEVQTVINLTKQYAT